MTHNRLATLALTLVLCGAPMIASAQLEGVGVILDLPFASPGAEVSQTIGLSKIDISYNRPGVKGRTIWGGLEKLNGGKPFPWRAGANENTVITFSDDVTINGQALPAGSYGFHIALGEGDWTLIFSNNTTSWGSFFYRPADDALRVTAAPQDAAHEEWLRYGFENITSDSTDVYLRWEKKKVLFTAKFDVHDLVLADIRNQLKSLPGFTWHGFFQAARYCFQNDINHEEAIGWIDQSIGRDENHSNVRLRGEILAQMGKNDEARTALERALEIAPERGKAAINKALEALN